MEQFLLVGGIMIAFLDKWLRKLLGFDEQRSLSDRGFISATAFAETATDDDIVRELQNSYACPDPNEWDDAWRQVLESNLRLRGWTDEEVWDLS